MKPKPKPAPASLKGDSGDYARLVMAAFDNLEAGAEAEHVTDLNRRRRQVEENAKKRF